MADKPETRFKKRIRPLLESLPNSYWVKIDQAAIIGCPDFYGCLNGTMVLIELKKDEKSKVAPLQEWHLRKVAMAGGIGMVICPENWENSFATLYHLAYDASNNAYAGEEPGPKDTIQ